MAGLLLNEDILRLSDTWWSDLDEKFGFPADLCAILRSLVSATMMNCIPPAATPRLIRLLKEHLPSGIAEELS